MFASSSPPNVSRVRHGPRSSATTRTPRSVRTLAAVAPEAPAPMMQTSARAGLALRAMAVVPLPLGEPSQRAVAAGEHLLEGRGAGEADHPPAHPVAVPTVDRVGVEALAGVHDQERHELELGLGAGLLQSGLAAGRGGRLGVQRVARA